MQIQSAGIIFSLAAICAVGAVRADVEITYDASTYKSDTPLPSKANIMKDDGTIVPGVRGAILFVR